MSLKTWLIEHYLSREVDLRIEQAVKVIDDQYWQDLRAPSPLARRWYEIRRDLEVVDKLYKTNPLAARLVSMTTDFVIGAWSKVAGPEFVMDFWEHPLNHMPTRIYRWSNELAKTGELFLVLSRNPVDKMSYVRELPAISIDEIDTDPDDLELELRFHQLTEDTEGKWWNGQQNQTDDQIMLHYTVNKPIGEKRGMSDLAQVFKWLERYDLWLEDRVRINRYKGAYLWHVKIEGAMPGQLEAKRAQYSRVPKSGSILVTDGTETWTAVQPSINADDAEADGKAIRLMIAAGGGVPLHFLAEGESATRATAREMGTPTYRRFVHRQLAFRKIIVDVLSVAARRAEKPTEGIDVEFESVMAEYAQQTSEMKDPYADSKDPPSTRE